MFSERVPDEFLPTRERAVVDVRVDIPFVAEWAVSRDAICFDDPLALAVRK